MPSANKNNLPPLPETVSDREGNIYKKGKFLGRGGFARCYEYIDSHRRIYALKAVAKSVLQKPGNREKMVQEIGIHKGLSHKNVVQLYIFVEDVENVYMFLEYCSNRSMMEMQKRRGHVTEPEARYYMKEIVVGVRYLHEKLIIHRDLKLGNIFLDKHMHCKIGDFGLATQLNSKDERKETVCGTPNYIAPEMLHRQKHSFEVDIWALGCILYTLLCGHPPFETTSLHATYAKIKNNSYRLPSAIGVDATVLIRELLHPDYKKRPSIQNVSKYNFWNGFCPDNLPVSCLTTAPKINDKLVCGGVYAKQRDHHNVIMKPERPVSACGDAHVQDAVSMVITSHKSDKRLPKAQCKVLFHHLKHLLDNFAKKSPTDTGIDVLGPTPDIESECPRYAPVYFVTRWVDYSDKYGLGYQLGDNSYGVLFNDGTKVILDAAQINLNFVEIDGTEIYFTMNKIPQQYAKKVQLLRHFRDYMKEQLLEAGLKANELGAELARPPLLNYWFRLKNVIVLHLTNGIVQVNFFDDHIKLIFCPMVQAVTVITNNRTMHTYTFELLSQSCSRELGSRIQYALALVERLVVFYKNPEMTYEEAVELLKG